LSLRIYVRKILGRKGTFFLRNVLSTITIGLRLIETADKLDKKEGITAMVCTYNDPDWIEPSLVSIKDLVNEYLVIDSSTDETPDIIKSVGETYGLNIRLYRIPPGDLVAARNLVLEKTSYKWILHWDIDFVAKPELIDFIKNLLNELNPKYYYLIYWPHIQFCGDLSHLCNQVYHVEHWLFTWSPKLYYKWLGRYDSLIAPIYMYKAIYIDKPLSLHLRSVRNPVRLAFKHLWWRFREEFNKLAGRNIDLMEYARKKALEVYNTDDLEELGKRLIEKQVSTLKEYDTRVYGEYPKILLDYLRKKKWLYLISE